MKESKNIEKINEIAEVQNKRMRANWRQELRNYLILLCVLGFGYLLFSMMRGAQENRTIQTEEKYPFIEHLNMDIRGIVIYNEITLLLNNTNLIELNNNIKFRLTKAGSNYNLRPNRLQYFLTPGDSIVKLKDTDTLYIYRKGEKFYFITGHDIGYKR